MLAVFCRVLLFCVPPAVRKPELMFTSLPKWVRIFCSNPTSSESMKMGSEPSLHLNSRTLKLVESCFAPSFASEYALIAIFFFSFPAQCLTQPPAQHSAYSTANSPRSAVVSTPAASSLPSSVSHRSGHFLSIVLSFPERFLWVCLSVLPYSIKINLVQPPP